VPGPKSNEESTKVNEAVEDVEIVDNEDDDGVNTAEVFQQFMTNKEREFKRTSPAVSAAANKPKSSEIKCEKCGYIASNKQALSDHIIRVLKITRRTDMRTEPKKILYFHYWNNGGSCNFEERTGRPCKFEHTQAPRCIFDGNCNRKACMFSLKNQNTDDDIFFREQVKGIQTPSPGATGDQEGKSKKILVKKPKRGGQRSGKNGRKSKNKIDKFSILGNNCFGLKAKKESLYQTI
jgi:hypothetical protein